MKVSVIVPVYNVEKYIKKCLDSLVEQTLKQIEIIIVNDGATDQSQEVIDQYCARYENILSFSKMNGGLSDARNYGMKYARGEYIAFVDSDDYIEKDMLEKLYEKAESENLDIVVCDTCMEYSGYSYTLKSNLHFTDDPVRAYVFASPMACTRLVRRTIMEKFSFQKGILYEDLNVTPTYIIETRKVGFLEEPLYHYVQRENSIMNQADFNIRLLDIFKVISHVKEVFEAHGMYEEFHEEIEYLYLIHLLRSAVLRFLQYKNAKKYLKQINTIIAQEFPCWKKNSYLKKSSLKFKIVCYLAFYKQYTLLRLLNRLNKH